MAKTFTVKDAVQHLRAHPVDVSDSAVAAEASRLFRASGVPSISKSVSRPLVSMIRRGKGRGERGNAWKSRAVWQALVNLGAVPALPAEFAALGTPRPGQRAAGGRRPLHDVEWYRNRVAELERRFIGESRQEVMEIPMLTPPILKYFGFTRNPVYDEILGERDVWWSRQHLEAKELLIDAVLEARFVRLAGSRGCGKSLVAERAKRELGKRDDVVLAEPSPVLAGTVSAGDLITAVVQAIKRKKLDRDEVFSQAQDRVRRSLAMQFLLREARQTERHIALWIDEAHELRAETFVALKRFLDELYGGRRLLGVVLIGQHAEVSGHARTRDLSEVTLRMQTLKFEPMTAEIPDYLRHKIERAGGKVSEVITPRALKAIAARCPYPLDANALFAQLLIDSFRRKEKPIGQDDVETAAPDMDDAEVNG